MFNAPEAFRIADKHQLVLRELHRIQEDLERRFHGLHDAILALILSVASGEPLLLIGPPGTAKSMLIRRFCALIGVNTQGGAGQYFEILLTPFTEPGELFGFYDIKALSEGQGLVRLNEESMMQNATVVFLDEVFKGSSAILHSLLSFMNERKFLDRGVARDVPLRCLFAATNEVPDSSELRAVLDRFVLRCKVRNVLDTHQELGDLAEKAWALTYQEEDQPAVYPGLLDDLEGLRADIRKPQQPLFSRDELFLRDLARLVVEARQFGLSDVSNRRIVKLLYIMMIHRMYDAVRAGEQAPAPGTPFLRVEERNLLPKYFLDRWDETFVARMLDPSGVVTPR